MSRRGGLAAGVALALALGAAACGGRSAPADPPETSSLYQRLGGLEGLRPVVDEWVAIAASDPRIQAFFVDADIARLELRLLEHLCLLAGGPCVYQGRELDEAHAGMGLRDVHLEAFVGDLSRALVATGADPDAARALLVRVRRVARDLAAAQAP